ncbi:MAG: hypothetical protein HC902_10740 [Calothrix sp. SM1_5_4]|nr:hypothetical protein [Calothrix sp. SM1_5_4]
MSTLSSPSRLLFAVLGLLAFAVLPLHAQRERLPPEDLEIVEQRWPGAKKTYTGLRYLVQQPGEGEAMPKAGDMVSVVYKGMLLNGKVFESYIVDPEALPAFKEFVLPLLKNLGAVSDGDRSEPGFLFFLKMKTWYIAPVELDKFGKEALGVSFIKSETQQIAIQTRDEIWIDKTAFDQMSSQDQGQLILHELVMNMYFLKFMSVEELCRRIERDKENESFKEDESHLCDITPEDSRLALPALPLRPLTAEDNENIRHVTGWILKSAVEPVKLQDFNTVLSRRGFDRRFFGPDIEGENEGDRKNSPESPPPLKVDIQEIHDVIQAAALTGEGPTLCTAVTVGTSKTCSVSVERVSKSPIGIDSHRLVTVKAAQAEVKLDLVLPSEGAELSETRTLDGWSYYPQMVYQFKTKYEVGDRIYSAALIFKKSDRAPLKFHSMVLVPAVVVSVKDDGECKVRPYRPLDFTSDRWIIHSSDTDISDARVERTLLLMPPFAPCIASEKGGP